jgi:hypothetical protein
LPYLKEIDRREVGEMGWDQRGGIILCEESVYDVDKIFGFSHRL